MGILLQGLPELVQHKVCLSWPRSSTDCRGGWEVPAGHAADPRAASASLFLSIFHPWGTWHSCSLAIRKPSFYQTHPLLIWALLMAPSHRNAAVQIWDWAWFRAGFRASVYLLLLYREFLALSVLQLTLVKTQIKEVSCSPWVFSFKLHEILDILFSWSTDCWWHGWIKKTILVASWSKCSKSCDLWSCEVLLIWKRQNALFYKDWVAVTTRNLLFNSAELRSLKSLNWERK